MKFTYFIKNKIKSIDSFGDPITLTINKEETLKTFFGGMLNMILLILMLILFCIQVTDSFTKSNPNISSFIKIKDKVDPMNFNKTGNPIAFAVQDEDGFFYDNMITLAAKLYTYEITDGDWKISFKNQILVNCTQDYFPLIDEKSFFDYAFNRFKCIQNQDFTLNGSINDLKFTTLVLEVQYCDEDELNQNNCKINNKKKALLEKGLTTIYFNLYFLNNYYDLMNYTQPHQIYTENMFTNIDIEKIKFSQIFFNKQKLTTDDGLIFRTEKHQTILSLETLRSDVLASYYNPNLMAQIFFHPSNKEYTSIRTYNKIQSVMADIMALFEYLKLGLKILFIKFYSTKKNVKLMNNIFEFDLNNSNGKSTNKIMIFTNNLKDLTNRKNTQISHNQLMKFNLNTIGKEDSAINKTQSFNKIREENINVKNSLGQSTERNDVLFNSNLLNSRKKLFENSQINLKRDDSHINEIPLTIQKSINYNGIINNMTENKNVYIKTIIKQKQKENNDFYSIRKSLRKNKSLDFSTFEIIKINLLNCFIRDNKLQDKFELYQMAEEKIDKIFEINYIMKKLDDVEKMKTILFNKEQLCIFNLSSNELLSLNSETTKSYEYNKLKEFQSDSKKINQEIHKFKQRINHHPQDLFEIDTKLFNQLPLEMKEILINNNQSN